MLVCVFVYVFVHMSVSDLSHSGVTSDILCDVGMPIVFQDVRYNCRVFVLDSKVRNLKFF